MQMFGVGVLEMLLVLVLTVIVVGPDKMPQLAADLGRWIRQTRAYARHLLGDFNEVVRELEQEANVSREDWQEIASVVRRNTGVVGQELSRFGRDIEAQQRDLTDIKELTADHHANGSTPAQAEEPEEEEDETEELDAVIELPTKDEEATEPEEEKPWYVPERASRRRSSE